MKAQAYVNYGRWLAKCPKCGSANPIKTADKVFVCAGLNCYPDLLAMKQTLKLDAEGIKKVLSGELLSLDIEPTVVVDIDKRKSAVLRARAAGEEYEIVFKYEPKKIDNLLRQRQWINMHWYPEETLADLKDQNDILGIKVK